MVLTPEVEFTSRQESPCPHRKTRTAPTSPSVGPPSPLIALAPTIGYFERGAIKGEKKFPFNLRVAIQQFRFRASRIPPELLNVRENYAAAKNSLW